ncbi:MAG: hypothetical protein LBD03_03920 [Methanobrevibacter sp.]|jgi:hypothetical protein|nr:hypothetical protein [Candidatus Methanovirga procula]
MGELDINPLIKACESLSKALEFAKILESEFSTVLRMLHSLKYIMIIIVV